MRNDAVVIGTAVVVVTGALLTLPLHAARQSSTGAPSAQAKPRNTAEKSVAIRRLPDGTPDIRGRWTRVGGGLNEAKPPETQLKAFGVLAEPQGFGQGDVAAGRGGGSQGSREKLPLPVATEIWIRPSPRR